MQFAPIQSPRIYQQIATRIAEMIVGGDLKPGARLPNEQELARMFEVSRGPVREAMIALETSGLIEVRHGDGAYVRTDTAHGVNGEWSRLSETEPGPFDQFEMREILLPEAAARAATRITEEQLDELDAMIEHMWSKHRGEGARDVASAFTVLVAAASGNAMMHAVIDELMRLHRGQLWTTLRARSLGPEPRRRAIECRVRLVKALRARDPEAARAAATDYVRVTKEIYFGDLAAQPAAD